MAWSDSRRALWSRIAAHPPGGAEAPAFEARVARDNGWSLADAREAIAEYRRFVFLACIGTREATPSKAVDAVWHVHLLYTRDYWEVFCPVTLGMPLHHSPGGGPGDEARYAAQYAATLAAYEEYFGPPPARWWPVRNASPAPVPQCTLMPKAAAIALVAVPALAFAAVRPANPLDWQGGDFLMLYAVLLVATGFASLMLRAWLRRQGEDVRDGGALSTLEVAYLAGGEGRVVDAAVAELHRRGAITWDAAQRRFERRDSRERLDGDLGEFATAITADPDAQTLARRAANATARLRAGLERRGLWQRVDEARRIGRIAAAPSLVLLGFGIAKIVIGVQRERPVTALVVLCALTAVLALVMLLGGARPTAAGRQALARTRAAHRAGKRGRGIDDIGLAVALGGTALLANTALAGYHEMRAPSGSSSSDSSTSSSPDSSGSDSSSDSGGGSSCGGCGGGGGGD